MTKEISCGAIIIKNGKVLLVEQNNDIISFPKGHQEKGENRMVTAIRETKEETNLDIEIVSEKEYKVSYIVKDNTPKDTIFYLAREVSNNDLIPQSTEVRNVFWVPLEEVRETINRENIKELWDEVFKDIVKNKIL